MVKRRGQIFSLDAMFAVGLFILILIVANWAWNISGERVSLQEKRTDLELISHNVLSTLIQTEGNPSNWTTYSAGEFNTTNIKSLGLAKSTSANNNDPSIKTRPSGFSQTGPWIIDYEKVKKLDEADYSTVKEILGIKGAGYNYEIEVAIWNGSAFATNTTIGVAPPSNASQVIRSDRFAIIDDARAQLTLKVSEQCYGVYCNE